MTDPLGQSQVMPYLQGLSTAGYKITLLSCEKKDKLNKNKAHIEKLLAASNISWHYTIFSSSPPLLSKLYDVYMLQSKAFELHNKNKFSLVHCRSYIAADIGCQMKNKFGIKFLFDMRGFWVDERVDGGLWDLHNPFYKWIYKKYKKKEAAYFSAADSIISLTEEGKKELMTWKCYNGTEVHVIPCSADFELFSLTTTEQKQLARKKLAIGEKDTVVSYLGSIGTWYMLDEMLDFFVMLKRSYPNSKFLFITNGEHERIRDRMQAKNIAAGDVIITSGKREEIPLLAKAADLSLSFIRSSYSKKSSSPTKMGELLAMGIPVVCNDGVGDVKQIIEQTKGGLVINDFSEKSFKKVIDNLAILLSLSPQDIRSKAFEYYDLNKAREKYIQVYKTLLKN